MPQYFKPALATASHHRGGRLLRKGLVALLLAGATLAWLTPVSSVHAQTAVAAQVSSAYKHIEDLIQQRRFGDAIEAADQYLASNERDPQVRFMKGVAQSGAGDTDAAIATFGELIQIYPELPEPYNNLAALYAGRGEYGKARDALQQAIQANPAYAVAHENLGDIYIQLAAEQYRTARQLDGRNTRLEPKLRLTEQLLKPAVR